MGAAVSPVLRLVAVVEGEVAVSSVGILAAVVTFRALACVDSLRLAPAVAGNRRATCRKCRSLPSLLCHTPPVFLLAACLILSGVGVSFGVLRVVDARETGCLLVAFRVLTVES